MPLIELKGDEKLPTLLVEVSDLGGTQFASGAGAARKLEESLQMIESTLKAVCKPIQSVYGELDQDLGVHEVEIELGLGFEVEGNVYVAKMTGQANLKITLKCKPIKQK